MCRTKRAQAVVWCGVCTRGLPQVAFHDLPAGVGMTRQAGKKKAAWPSLAKFRFECARVGREGEKMPLVSGRLLVVVVVVPAVSPSPTAPSSSPHRVVNGQ